MDWKFEFWRKWLLVASVFFAFQSVFWAVLGSFDPFGFFDRHAAWGLFRAEDLPPEVRTFQSFILGPFGATTAGYFILVCYLAYYPLARKESWALRAVAAAILTWFILDTSLCMIRAAYFNIVIVNLPCILVLGPPLFFLRRALKQGIQS